MDCVIPAYNEAGRVGRTVRILRRVKGISRVIVVDDGSDDSTAEEAERAGAAVICHPSNKGKTEALRTGAKHAKSDKILLADADILPDPRVLEDFIRKSGKYDMLIYYRETDEQAIQRLWRFLFMSQLLYSGLRVVRREDILRLPKGRYSAEIDLNRISGRIGIYVGPYFFHFEKYKKMRLPEALFKQAGMIAEIIYRSGFGIVGQMAKFRALLRRAEKHGSVV